MSRFREKMRSPRAQIAAVAGASVLVLAAASRWLVPEPIGYLSLAFPPFLAVVYESVCSKRAESRICTTWYWLLAIAAATVLVIVLHWV